MNADEKSVGFLVYWAGSVFTAIALLYWFTISKNSEFSSPYRVLVILFVLLSHPVYVSLNVFCLKQSLIKGFLSLALGWSAVVSLLAIIGFVTKTSAIFSREVIVIWFLLGFFGQFFTAVLVYLVIERVLISREGKIDSIVVGTGAFAQGVRSKISTIKGVRVADKILQYSDNSDFISNAEDFELCSEIQELKGRIKKSGARTVYLAFPIERQSEVKDYYLELLDLDVDLLWIPDVTEMLLLSHTIKNVSGVPAIHLNDSPLTSSKTANLVKAGFDKVIAVMMLLILLPVMLVTAIAVKSSSPGPIIFVQQRHGHNGRVFKLYKFRSLYLHDDPSVRQVTRNDSRMTKVGQFIRKWSIDELPQLVNVLKGEMSLVGPRPHAVEHGDYYSERIQSYMVRHKIKPGLTGLAQISGARGETDTVDKMRRRFELDLEYINNWSLILDLVILIKTPLSLFRVKAG